MRYRSNTDLRYAYALFGAEAIDRAGIAVLGYPGLWVTHNFEGTKIRQYLETNDNRES